MLSEARENGFHVGRRFALIVTVEAETPILRPPDVKS